jgi:hypothetical protein
MYCHAGERHEPDISRLWLSNGYFYNACVCSVKFLMISNREMSEVWGGGRRRSHAGTPCWCFRPTTY